MGSLSSFQEFIWNSQNVRLIFMAEKEAKGKGEGSYRQGSTRFYLFIYFLISNIIQIQGKKGQNQPKIPLILQAQCSILEVALSNTLFFSPQTTTFSNTNFSIGKYQEIEDSQGLFLPSNRCMAEKKRKITEKSKQILVQTQWISPLFPLTMTLRLPPLVTPPQPWTYLLSLPNPLHQLLLPSFLPLPPLRQCPPLPLLLLEKCSPLQEKMISLEEEQGRGMIIMNKGPKFLEMLNFGQYFFLFFFFISPTPLP